MTRDPADPRTRARLVGALERLPPAHRDVYLLCARDGLTAEQVATRLGMAPADVTRTLAAALVEIDRIVRSP